jgi:hypothetical protein
MKKVVAGGILSLLFAANVFAVAPPSTQQQPQRDILGVRIGMSADEVRSQLNKIGRLDKTERKRHEVWEVRDAYFSGLIIQFDKANRVHFVTAVARAEAERQCILENAKGKSMGKNAKRKCMRYTDVANINKAGQKTVEKTRNNYRYEWVLDASGADPKIKIVAMGSDPDYLKYYSIERAN